MSSKNLMETNKQANSRLTHIWWLSREYLHASLVVPDITDEILQWIARDSALDYWFSTSNIFGWRIYDLPIELALPEILYFIIGIEKIKNIDWHSTKDRRAMFSIRSIMSEYESVCEIDIAAVICYCGENDEDEIKKNPEHYPNYLKQLLFLRAFLVEDLLGPRTHRGVLARIDHMIKIFSNE